ncbi:MAG: heavy metal-binding domain-containing protein [Actinomycetota bacterium]|nr:heavy metal-binding domain-containing protein [Actinomycetota bacterium]
MTPPPDEPPQAPQPPSGESPPANWYSDPNAAGQLRYWDGTRWTEHVSSAQAPTGGGPGGPAGPSPVESQPGAINAPLADYSGPPILVSTMNDVPGHEITEVHGEVFGLVVRSRNMFSNIGAGFRTMFGGEARGYTKLLSDSRQEAVARLKHATHEVGGNAVIAMRFDANEIADVMSEVAAYGTAVTMHKS